ARIGTASRTSTPARSRRNGSSACVRTQRSSSASCRRRAIEHETRAGIRTGAREAPRMTDIRSRDPGLLGALVSALAGGRIRVVDLTQALAPEFPQIALPPEMGQCWPFRIEEISRYDE